MSRLATAMHAVQEPATVVVEEKVRQAIEEAVERTLESPEFLAQVTTEIRNLAQTVKNIREGFRAVADDLLGFDNDEYKDKDGKALRLRPQWLQYQVVYDEILLKSRRNAIAASSLMRQYTQAVLTDVSPGEFEDVRVELRGFLKKLDKKVPAALQTEGDLKELVDKVRSFQALIDETLRKADVKCVSDINEAKKQLQELDKQLQSLSVSENKKKLSVIAAGGFLLGGACGIAAIFVLAPSATSTVMDSVKEIGVVCAGYCGIQGWRLYQQGAKVDTEMQECHGDIAHKGARHHELLCRQAALSQTKEHIQSLAKRVDSITDIWLALKCDMEQLQDQLACVVDSDMLVTKRFLKKLDPPRKIYNRLADLLELYAKGKF